MAGASYAELTHYRNNHRDRLPERARGNSSPIRSSRTHGQTYWFPPLLYVREKLVDALLGVGDCIVLA